MDPEALSFNHYEKPQGLGSEEEEEEVSLRIRKVKKKSYKKRSASIVNPAPILPALLSFIRCTESAGKIGAGFTIDADLFL